MQDKELREAISKKAYEIAYALSRLAPTVRDELGDALLKNGTGLLDAALSANQEKIFDAISAVDYLMKFGYGVDAITQRNTDLVLGQTKLLGDMALTIRIPGKKGAPDVNLEGIFSDGFGHNFVPAEPIAPQEAFREETGNVAGYGNESSQKVEPEEDIKSEADGEPFAVSISAGIRQSGILKHIRQSGNCRMKDLQDLFPRCSERTLRYDLESLIGRHLIERVGAGSATTYRPLPAAENVEVKR